MADLLRGDSAFVRDRSDHGTRLEAFVAAQGQTVGRHVLIAGASAAARTAAVTTTIAVAVTALTARRLGHRLGLERIRLEDEGGESGRDVRGRHVAGERVRLDDLGKFGQFGGSEHIVDALRELLDASVRQLLDAGQGQRFDLLLRGALDRAEHALFARGDEEDRLTGTSGTTGAADAVDVGLGVVRDVVVDDQGDAFDVESAGGHVGGDEDVDLAFAQHVDRALTCLLGDVAVDRGGLEPAGAQLLGQLLGGLLRAHEHDDALVLLDLEDAGQSVELVRMLDHEVALADIRTGLRLRGDPNFLRIVQVLAGDPVDRGRHGGREQSDLTVLTDLAEDLFDVFGEAHLEHLVGLVEDEVTQAAELERPLLQVVDDTTRGAHDDLRTTAQTRQLRAVGLSAVDREHGEVGKFSGIGGERLGDLDREFASGGEDESERAVVGAPRLGEVGQGRQGEGRGLAGSGLGETDDVTARQEGRDRLGLDGGGDLVALRLYGLEHERVESQFGESRSGFVGCGHIGHE